IASATLELPQLVGDGRFSRELAREFSVLETRMPALRERSGDIPALARGTIARLGFDADTKLSAELMAACLAYRWPENLAELERLLGRLATMTGTEPVQANDIRRYAPEMACEAPGVRSSGAADSHALEPAPLGRWALRTLDPEDDFAELEPSLAKALRHLGACFAEPIDLADLAAIGGTTPLRMSALFRTVVGVSFKRLLRQIRILAACERLVQQPAASITELAFQVGFGDLSYFERSFRSAIGESPRQFRRRRRVGEGSVLAPHLSDSAKTTSGSVRVAAEAD
ncbi:MAG: helix-turn-helix domain-containing protein, partial [Alphaproteobacteria bacterium]|nr:helix-turn-helix domain-containing protein [Alphaproteobacteria bacterium]